MSTERESLIAKIREGWPEHGTGYYEAVRAMFYAPDVRDGGVTAKLIDYAVDTVLEATKPRTITTAEEVDGLPDESVVRCRLGATYEKFHDEDGLSCWMMIGYQRMFAGTSIPLPATVLFEGQA